MPGVPFRHTLPGRLVAVLRLKIRRRASPLFSQKQRHGVGGVGEAMGVLRLGQVMFRD